MKRFVGALSVLALGAGCEMPGTDPGELGNGAFTYSCAGSTDAWCETPFRHGGRPLPALGAPFAVRYSDGEVGAAEVIPVAPSRLTFARGRFAFRVPGPGALLARDTTGTVRDFFHLEGAAIATLELVRTGPSQLEGVAPDQTLAADPWAVEPLQALPLAGGTRATLFGYPVAAGGDVLTGSAVWSFSVVPEGVVQLHAVEGDNVVEIEALAAGDATLVAQAAGVVRQLPVHVEVGP